ncbi:MAG: aspartate aminotransferase [SAR116 cluster bacterium]|nr:aspartate aminotransferase [SAR116 cluster bacterium]|tara:strand:- start:5395 stop:6597 length:1203 start_codon:yes stop_codon:yes gene_type:complete
MEFISENLKKIKPSPTMVITAKARELKAKGENVISLSSGEPDFDTPEHIKEAAIKAIHAGYTKYTNVEGITELKEAIVKKFEIDNYIKYKSQEVIVGVGGKQILFNALLATLNLKDEVIIPTPYWVSYPDMTLLAGGNPKFLPCDIKKDFKIDADNLNSFITENTKWLILNSPSNPSGSCYTKRELEDIAKVIRNHPQVNVITDDIYEYILYDDFKFYTLAQVAPDLKDRILTVNGVSKSYCMTGWRIGYAAGREDLIKAMIKIQGQSTSNASSVSQYAALAGIEGSRDFLMPCLEAFDKRRNLVVNKLNDIDGIKCVMPKGAFYAYPNVEGLLGKKTQDGKILNNDTDVTEWLLENAKVATVPGVAFGLEPYFRVSYATSYEVLEQALENIKMSVESLV